MVTRTVPRQRPRGMCSQPPCMQVGAASALPDPHKRNETCAFSVHLPAPTHTFRRQRRRPACRLPPARDTPQTVRVHRPSAVDVGGGVRAHARLLHHQSGDVDRRQLSTVTFVDGAESSRSGQCDGRYATTSDVVYSGIAQNV